MTTYPLSFSSAFTPDINDPNSIATQLYWGALPDNVTMPEVSVAPNVTPAVSPTGVQAGMPSAFGQSTLSFGLTQPSTVNAGVGATSKDSSALTSKGWGDLSGLEKLKTGLGIAGGLAEIWSGIQQNRLARDSFEFNKGLAQTNLANQIMSYNTALEDRMNARYSSANRDQAAIDKYIADHKASSSLVKA